MLWLSKLVEDGYLIETVLSKQPGFELILLVNKNSGERVLYWRRTSEITTQAVEHLKKLVKVPIDKLFIEFTGKPQITADAEQMLKQLFKTVEIHTTKELESRETTRTISNVCELYDGNVLIVKKKFTRGNIRIGEAEHVLENMQYLSDNVLWLIVIEQTRDGKLKIYDAHKNTWQEFVNKALEEGSRVVIFAVWHGQYSTDVFLLYPTPRKQS